MARVREAGAAIAEASLEEVASGSGPVIGGGMRIAILKDSENLFAEAALEPVKLFKERDKSGGMLHRARLIEPLGDACGGSGANLGSEGRGTDEGHSLFRGLGFRLGLSDGFFFDWRAERHCA